MQSGGGGRRGRRSVGRPVAEINVTPLVDVMMVLLIVFMVTAPMMTVSVPVDLPKTQAARSNPQQDKEPLVISIDANAHVYLQDSKVELTSLVSKLRAITGSNPDTRIFVRGDQNIAYGRIMEVMGTVSAAGFSKVALVAELPHAPAAVPTTSSRSRSAR